VIVLQQGVAVVAARERLMNNDDGVKRTPSGDRRHRRKMKNPPRPYALHTLGWQWQTPLRSGRHRAH
jgi:hypothetical protein